MFVTDIEVSVPAHDLLLGSVVDVKDVLDELPGNGVPSLPSLVINLPPAASMRAT